MNVIVVSDTTVTISVTGSNDLPTVTLVTPTLDAGTTADASTIDENDEFSATVTIDEGGGRDENSQSLTVTLAEYDDCTSPAAPATSLLDVASATYSWGIYTGDLGDFDDSTVNASVTTFSFAVPAVANTSGTGCVGVTINDGTDGSSEYYFPVTVDAIDDAPTITLSNFANVTTIDTDEYQASDEGDNLDTVTFDLVVDEGGGSDENRQAVTVEMTTAVAVTGDSVTANDFIIFDGSDDIYNVTATIAAVDAGAGTYEVTIKAPTGDIVVLPHLMLLQMMERQVQLKHSQLIGRPIMHQQLQL